MQLFDDETSQERADGESRARSLWCRYLTGLALGRTPEEIGLELDGCVLWETQFHDVNLTLPGYETHRVVGRVGQRLPIGVYN